MSVAPEEGSFRRGPRSQIALLERTLRRHLLLADDDHIIEWRQGWIRRWRVDGVEQPGPAFDRMRRAVGRRGDVELQLLFPGSLRAIREHVPVGPSKPGFWWRSTTVITMSIVSHMIGKP